MPEVSVFGPEALWFGVFDALSARLVADYEDQHGSGHPIGLWVSSFCISASLRACPDVSIVNSTDMLAVARAIGAVSGSLPVVVDCDCGYGDATVFEHVVAEIGRTRSASALCVEDKVFPKRNSFYYGCEQALQPIATFQELISAGRAAASGSGDDVKIIARTEALVLGSGPDEAIARMRAYEEAGADAVMVQAVEGFEDVILVAKQWRRESELPLIAVPTAFPSCSPREIWDLGFDVFVYANQLLRAAVAVQYDLLVQLHDADRPFASAVSPMWAMSDINHLVGANRFDGVRPRGGAT